MNQVRLRRIALVMASVSAGLLVAVLIPITALSMDGETGLDGIYHSFGKHTDSVCLPHTISCTSVEVVRLASYDGPFYEDGSGREVMNAAALEIYNKSNELIPYAYIIVYTANEQYTFRATMIPPQASVLIPESQAQTLGQTEMVHIFGWTTVKQPTQPYAIEIAQRGKNRLQITNLSEKTISELTVFHRTYVPEGDIYCGGIAFETEIPQITPGESVTVHPIYYVSGYSHIVHYE